MRGRERIIILGIFMASVLNMHAQKISISTNALSYLNLLTLNAEIGYSVDKNWSIFLSGKYNPFSFSSNTDFVNKQATISIGTRYWPWHTYSGFFYGAKLQYSRYNQGGIISPLTQEGNAYGLGINFGYSLLISKFLNLEFGVGVWMGETSYIQYAGSSCGKLMDQGKKIFFAPNDALLSLVFIF